MFGRRPSSRSVGLFGVRPSCSPKINRELYAVPKNSFFFRKLTFQGTNISPKNGTLKMIFLFPRWDMLIPWRVNMHTFFIATQKSNPHTKRWTFHSPESICQITLFRFVFFSVVFHPPEKRWRSTEWKVLCTLRALYVRATSVVIVSKGDEGERMWPHCLCVCVCFEKKEALWNLHMICI